MRALLLDVKGLLASVLIGALVFFMSGSYGLQNLSILFFFLFISVAATKHMHYEKKQKGVYEHERSWQNVLSNGGVAAITCAGFFFTGNIAWLAAFIGAVAGATADKFASELGVLSKRPISLGTFKPVKQGTSGAISLLGTYLSFIGPLLIGLVVYYFYDIEPFSIFVIALIGFAGSMADSIFGVLEERGIGTKSTTNIICTIASAILGYFFLVL